MSYHPHHERGHSLTTTRGKNASNMLHRIFEEESPFDAINNWEKANREIIDRTWWHEVFDAFDGNGEDLLDYLEQQLIIETAPSFSQKVANYEKFLNSKKSEFPGNGRE